MMRKGILLILALVLALAAALSACAEAAEIPAEPETVHMTQPAGGESGSSLFLTYLKRINRPAPVPNYLACQDLGTTDRRTYDRMKSFCYSLAAGTNSSAKLDLETGLIYDGKTTWTAAELGVSQVVTDGAVAEAAKTAFKQKFAPDWEKVMHALLADCPYEMYWYEKTQGWSYTYWFGARYIDGAYQLYVSKFGITFTVSPDFCSSTSDYETDSAKIQTAIAAIQKAQAIVDEHAGEPDIEKLYSYKDEICDLVSYNEDAAAGHAQYGNPWQMIWVFDGDPFHEVVCEGYSKAFAYLCELSDFSNASCTTVTGQMSVDDGNGEGHMWNIVTVNGRRYIADVTNCDAGTIGDPDLLFMKLHDSGSYGTGYCYECYGSYVLYVYDEDAVDLFPKAELTLSDYPLVDPSGRLVILPKDLTKVDEEAFAYTGAVEIVVGSKCTEIGSRAFANSSSLKYLVLPAGIKKIADNAVVNCPELVVQIPKGHSVLLKWAQDNYINYVEH